MQSARCSSGFVPALSHFVALTSSPTPTVTSVVGIRASMSQSVLSVPLGMFNASLFLMTLARQ
jgi:hypothetical protein